MTKVQLQAAVDDAAKTEIAHIFDVLHSNLIDKDDAKNAPGRFQAGLALVIRAHDIAMAAINAS